jgi:WD40 repeat protein
MFFGRPERRFHRNPVTCLAFCPGMPLLASGGEDYLVNLIHTDTYRRFTQIRSTTKTVMAVDFSPTGQLLLAASWDKAVTVYGATAAHPQICKLRDHTDCVYDAQFLTDDRIVSCSRDHTVRFFDVRRAVQISSFSTTSLPLSLCSIQNGSSVLTSHYDGHIREWDFRQRGFSLEFKVHPGRCAFVGGIPGMRHVLSFGADDKTIVASDLMMKSIVAKVVNRAVISREKMQLGIWNDQILIGGTGGELYSYDCSSLKLKNKMKGSGNPIYCVGTKSSGEVATGDQSGCVRFWTL